MAAELSKPQIIELAQHSVNYTLFDARWVPSSARFVALGNYARGTGAIEVCGLDDGRIVVHRKYEKPAAIKCGTFGASPLEERHLATGDFNVRLCINPIHLKSCLRVCDCVNSLLHSKSCSINHALVP